MSPRPSLLAADAEVSPTPARPRSGGWRITSGWAAVILPAVLAAAAATVVWGELHQQVADLASAHAADTASLRQDDSAQEARLRAVEQSQAAIGAGFADLKEQNSAVLEAVGKLNDKLDHLAEHSHH